MFTANFNFRKIKFNTDLIRTFVTNFVPLCAIFFINLDILTDCQEHSSSSCLALEPSQGGLANGDSPRKGKKKYDVKGGQVLAETIQITVVFISKN